MTRLQDYAAQTNELDDEPAMRELVDRLECISTEPDGSLACDGEPLTPTDADELAVMLDDEPEGLRASCEVQDGGATLCCFGGRVWGDTYLPYCCSWCSDNACTEHQAICF